jgi:hypothetical protein
MPRESRSFAVVPRLATEEMKFVVEPGGGAGGGGDVELLVTCTWVKPDALTPF